jgi:hypothetical protein
MRHGALTCLLVLLLGCGSPFSPVVRAPAPSQIPTNSTIRIWTSTGDRVVHHVSIRRDSLIGIVVGQRGPVAETRIAIPVTNIDSLCLVRESGGQRMGAFVVGFAIGAVLVWELIVGGN